MKFKIRLSILLAGLLVSGLFLPGCELGVNPILFDGSPVSANFSVVTTGIVYSDSRTIVLGNMLSGLDIEVDSLSVINVSLLIDSIGSSTPTSATISGTGSIDGHNLLTLTNVPLSAFTSERSIFDPTLVPLGVVYGSSGVTYLNNMLKHPDTLPYSINVAVNGSASQSNLRFTLHLKLYTQVFTHP